MLTPRTFSHTSTFTFRKDKHIAFEYARARRYLSMHLCNCYLNFKAQENKPTRQGSKVTFSHGIMKLDVPTKRWQFQIIAIEQEKVTFDYSYHIVSHNCDLIDKTSAMQSVTLLHT